MTATTASVELAAEMITLAETLGDYPHGRFTAFDRPAVRPEVPGEEVPDEPRVSSGPRSQGTRMLKLVAPCCGYTVRTTRKWIEVGMPSCPCGSEMELA
jgi:hypothetical protein